MFEHLRWLWTAVSHFCRIMREHQSNAQQKCGSRFVELNLTRQKCEVWIGTKRPPKMAILVGCLQEVVAYESLDHIGKKVFLIGTKYGTLYWAIFVASTIQECDYVTNSRVNWLHFCVAIPSTKITAWKFFHSSMRYQTNLKVNWFPIVSCHIFFGSTP